MKKTYSLFLLLLAVNFAAKAVQPKALPVSHIGNTSFQANWEPAAGTTTYFLTVKDEGGTPLPSYDYKDVGNVTSFVVTGLPVKKTFPTRTDYTYFISCNGENSNEIPAYTQIVTLLNGDFELWNNAFSRGVAKFFELIVGGCSGSKSFREPTDWNGMGTANGSEVCKAAYAGDFLSQVSGTAAYGGSGNSLKISSLNVSIATANGVATTGRVNAGSTTATNTANHNRTETNDQKYYHPMELYPDSIVAMIKYVPNSVNATTHAKMASVIHTDQNLVQDPTNNDANTEYYVARGDYYVNNVNRNAFQRCEVAFDYNTYGGANKIPKYILVSLTSNETPGNGDAADYIIVDNVKLVYCAYINDLKYSPGTEDVPGFNMRNGGVYKVVVQSDFDASNTVTFSKESLSATTTIESSRTGAIDNWFDKIIVTSGDLSKKIVHTVQYSELLPPTTFSISNRTSTSAKVSWGAGANATSYGIKLYSKEGAFINEYSTTSTTFDFTGLEEGLACYFTVTSINGTLSSNVSQNFIIPAHEYKITYNNLLSTNHSNPSTYTVESSIITLSAPTSLPGAGYSSFDGWFNGDGTKVETIATGSTGDLTLTAKWTMTTYNITYHLNGGSNHVNNPSTYNVETAVTLSHPTKTGYTFNGWYLDAGFGTSTTELAVGTTENKELWAKWTPTHYNITYELNGGTNDDNNPDQYTIETPTFTLLTPTKPGYDFDGWFTDDEFTTPITEIAEGSTENITLYAKWKGTTYTINYHLAAGENNNAHNPATYTTTTPTIYLADASKGCHTFKGWFKEPTFENKVTEVVKGSTGELNLYPKFEQDVYTVTFASNNNDWGTVNNTNENSVICGSSVSVIATPQSGYEFVGWFNAAGNVGNSPSLNYTPTESGLITAIFQTTGSFYISVSANPVKGGMVSGSGSYASGNECMVTATANDGYRFVNWTEGGSVVTVTDNKFNVSSARTLVANFELIDYTITYHNVHTVNSNPDNYNLETETFSLADLSPRPYYDFGGWFNADNAPVTQITKGSIGDKTFWAKWIPKTYTITYNPNNGESIANGNYNVETAVTLPTPTKTGYNFDGWFTNNGFTGTAVTEITVGSTGNKTLWAKWDLITYTITYHNVPSGVTNSNRTQYNINDLIGALSALVQDYYTFDGWYADAGFTTPISSITGVMGNVDIYAKWTPITYTITYNPNNGESIANGNYNVETAVTLPTPTKTGYNFEGWFTNSGTTGTAVTQIAIGSHGNQTLWAKWSLATYTITYHNVDNLYNPNQAKTSYTAESQTITLEPVEKEHHTFEGWFTDEGFTNAITQILAGSTGNLTLYAKLLPNQYIVSVSSNNAQGGVVSGNGTYGHGSTVTITATPNSGYKFIGWTENKVFVNAPASYTFTAEKARELVANFTGPLSVSDFAPEGIMAYAKDRQIFVRFTNDIDPEALIYLFDITGNLLHTKYCDRQEMSFNVSNIGLYFVQIGNRTIKVVVR